MPPGLRISHHTCATTILLARVSGTEPGVDRRTFDAFWMVLDAYGISVLVLDDDLGQVVRFDVVAPLLCVASLHDDHEAALTALV